MKKIASLFFCVLFLLGGCASGDGGDAGGGGGKGPTVVLNTQKGKTEILVDIADTTEERARGLMYKKSIPENYGMFFIFEQEQEQNFWMKNTLIPLDMVFFDRNYKVVKIAHDAQPCRKDPCMVYASDKPAKYVLEVNGGTADRLGLKEGDGLQLII
jgi:uncharacterized protein